MQHLHDEVIEGSERSRVDVVFPLAGTWIPLDHGYALFAAVCKILGNLHGCEWLAIHPIHGQPTGDGRLLITGRSGLMFRVPRVKADILEPLSDQVIWLNGQKLKLAAWFYSDLTPCQNLSSRLVIIKGYTEPELFHSALERQLGHLGAQCEVRIGRRRAVTINGDRVIGFGVSLHGLSDTDSLSVQNAGLGGRQRMGCGIFTPLDAASD